MCRTLIGRLIAATARVMLAVSLVTLPLAATAADPIRIGEINHFKRLAAFAEPYRKGIELAVEEINAAGGVLDRELEFIFRDDQGKPGEAIRIAEELVSRDGVVMLTGSILSNVGLAISSFAEKKGVVYLASEPLADALVWKKGNRHTFRLRSSTFMQASMLAELAAESDAVRYATIAPNYAYGRDAVAAFKAELTRRKPDVEFVAEQWPALFRIDAGAEVQALERARPDAIFNVTFGADLARFVREGSIRGLFDGREVYGLLTGEPEYLEPLADEAPEGWMVTGYPWYDLDEGPAGEFVASYRERFDETPKNGSLVGYLTALSVAAAIEAAGATDSEALIAAFRGLTLDTPLGEITYRALDHQSTMGAYTGTIGLRDGEGVMLDWQYRNGADYLPDEATVRKLRPADMTMAPASEGN